MDMDNAAVFLAGTILYALGIIIILVATVVANNIIHKYWKSFGWSFFPTLFQQEPQRFMTQEEAAKLEPTVDPVSGEKHKPK
jgi:cytochrome b561